MNFSNRVVHLLLNGKKEHIQLNRPTCTNCCIQPSVGTFCQIVCSSNLTTHTSKAFWETGVLRDIIIKDVLLQIIENACNLILSTELTLSEVAQRVGYTSSLTFTRAFKARYHMSSSEWRKLNEAINS
mgnify:CR=1 FL=1